MKIKFNCYIKHPVYGIVKPNKPIDMDEAEALKYVAQRLDHTRTMATLISPINDKPALKKNLVVGLQKKIKSAEKKLKLKEILIRTNEKKKDEIDARMDALKPERESLQMLKLELEDELG